jgi:hypothetical protein
MGQEEDSEKHRHHWGGKGSALSFQALAEVPPGETGIECSAMGHS